jgi:hypothetical protein
VVTVTQAFVHATVTTSSSRAERWITVMSLRFG